MGHRIRKHSAERDKKRLRRKKRVIDKTRGDNERPRLSVYRSSKHIYAQVVNDEKNQVLVSVSTLSKELKRKIKSSSNVQAEQQVGSLLAKKANAMQIKTVVFDRNGFLYHGRVRALADTARKAGLTF